VSALSGYHLNTLLWLCLSVLVYTVGTHVRESVAHRGPAYFLNRPVVQTVLEGLYFVGLPYLVLLQGNLLPSLLGLTDLDWLHDIGFGGALGIGALALTFLAFRYALPTDNSSSPSSSEERTSRVGIIALLWTAITQQIHWVFYRAAMIQIIGDMYWGAFAGLLLVILEWALDPGIRRRLSDPIAGRREIARLLPLATTTALYIFVRNLPLLIAIHWLFEIMLVQLFAAGPVRHPREKQEDVGKE